ncbi:MAG: hypothetical protein MRY83_18905 [Flavobacteriales bacterium]|nr:hypothetical protein [Flavobacteriales bacterium]
MNYCLLFCFFLLDSVIIYGQNVGINTNGSAPNESAILDLSASDKGLLIPRVSLNSVTDATTISGAEADALIVFNTNASMTSGNGAGFYFWNGTKWVSIPSPDNGPGNSGQVLISNGAGASPGWGDVTTNGGGSSGCADCISSISNTEWTSVNWSTCRENCRNLSESGFTDWRMATFDEAVFYASGVFDPPDGSWLNNTWTSSPYDARVTESSAIQRWVIFNENNGIWGGGLYNSTSINCRCVR